MVTQPCFLVEDVDKTVDRYRNYTVFVKSLNQFSNLLVAAVVLF